MKKDEAIIRVKESAGGLFTREDVLKILEQIETTGTENKHSAIGGDITANQLAELADWLDDIISNMDSSDVVDTYSAEFYLDGSSICLESVDVHNSNIADTVREAIFDWYKEKTI